MSRSFQSLSSASNVTIDGGDKMRIVLTGIMAPLVVVLHVACEPWVSVFLTLDVDDDMVDFSVGC